MPRATLGQLLLAVSLLAGCQAAAAPAVRGPLLQLAGSGEFDTATFTAPAEWSIDYTVDCSAFKQPVAFTIAVHGKQDVFGQRVDDMSMPISTTVTKTSGTAFARIGGQVYLSIVSACPWTITARA